MDKVYLCSFADSRMPETLKRVGKQAKESGFFEQVFLYDEHSLSVSFREKFKDKLILGSRGYGYWVWKPYVILETLKKIPENAVLLYMDAGCHINPKGKGQFENFVNRVKAHQGILAFQLGGDCIERYWTKGDLFDFFNIRDKLEITNSNQIAATTFFICNTDSNYRFIAEWMSVFDHFHLVDDTPSITPNLDGFIENRHDQSAFSILAKLRGIDTLSISLMEQSDKNVIWAMRDKHIKLIYRYSFRRFCKKLIKRIFR